MASSLSTPVVVASASSRLWHPASNGKISVPSASLSLRTGSRRSPFSLGSSSTSSQLLHCSFLSSSLSLSSAFSGLSIAFDFRIGTNGQKRRGLVVRAGNAALCQPLVVEPPSSADVPRVAGTSALSPILAAANGLKARFSPHFISNFA
ncbi:hypothetical protein F2Q69_00053944 [Brassica cretica]|uniref:Uncharacterized protein n=1 Tax=Brassica cretica TaxID=69181 RepID=A0A8S9MX91_BRACR|nr:hypothetical protein F2Q69_00053944 [Brassica cretica]